MTIHIFINIVCFLITSISLGYSWYICDDTLKIIKAHKVSSTNLHNDSIEFYNKAKKVLDEAVAIRNEDAKDL